MGKTLIKIPDAVIVSASKSIATFRAKNETNVSALRIEQQIRSYIYLGTNGLIQDWSYKLQGSDKDVIVTATIDRTQDQYSVRPAFAWVWTNFEILETLSATGEIPWNVARPREAQDLYDKQLAEAHVGDVNPILKGVQDFFGVTKASIEAMLKGLGLNIPLETIIVLVVVLIAVVLFRRYSTA